MRTFNHQSNHYPTRGYQTGSSRYEELDNQRFHYIERATSESRPFYNSSRLAPAINKVTTAATIAIIFLRLM